MTQPDLTSLVLNAKVLHKSNVSQHVHAQTDRLEAALRTSFGPLGLDKLIVASNGDVSLTNDGATIMKSLNASDPLQKAIIGLALAQEKEAGDGTTSVVLFSCELLKKGQGLKERMHANTVLNGYRLAYKECVSFIKNNLCKEHNKNALIDTCISSKIINTEKDLFISLLANAQINNNFKILKLPGGAMKDSHLLNGFVINCRPSNKVSPLKGNKILAFDFNLEKERMPLNVQIQIKDPQEIEKIKKAEETIARNRINKIIKTGCNVLLTTKKVDNFCLSLLGNILVVKHVGKEDLIALTKSFKATLYTSVKELDGNDTPINAFSCDGVEVKKYGDHEIILIKTKKTNTLMLRGSTETMLDEMERACLDVTGMLKNQDKIVTGAGAVECALFLHLKDFAQSISSKEFYAIEEYAECLLQLPLTLVKNAGFDKDLVAKVLKKQTELKSAEIGLDLENGTAENMFVKRVVEPAEMKMKMLRLATEAAISILRIDEIIEVEGDSNKGGQQRRR